MAFVLSRWAACKHNCTGEGSADTSSAAAGFSIESEMLTYRALQANSEAIACDIAAYVNGTNADFKTHPEGEVCDVKAGSKKATVVVLPFDSSEFADFQIWRADMATMDRLQNKADSLGCPTKPGASSKERPPLRVLRVVRSALRQLALRSPWRRESLQCWPRKSPPCRSAAPFMIRHSWTA